MKKLAIAGLLAAGLALPLAALAAEFRAGDNAGTRANERVAGDVYIAGRTVVSSGVIVGDLLAGGGDVLINGDIGADAMVGGGNVSLLSYVADDARIGGGTILIQGGVGGDLVAGGGKITVSGGGVGGDVLIGAGTVRIDAPVRGSVRIGGGEVYLNSPMSGNVEVEADSLTLGPGADIAGNLAYKGKKELSTETGAVVRGETRFEQREVRTEDKAKVAAILAVLLSAWVIGKFFAILLAALLLGLIFRRLAGVLVADALERPFLEIGRGLVLAVAIPTLSILALFTLIGIPVGVFGLLAYALLMLLSCVVAPIILGSLVKRLAGRDTDVTWQSILLGVLLHSLLGVVPFIGWIIQILLGFLALGVTGSLKWRVARDWR